MKILVTGGTGFIGRHLVNRLADEGHSVCVVARHAGGFWADHPRVRCFTADFAEPVRFKDILASMDRTYHLGWTTTPATAEQDWAKDIAENVLGSAEFLRALVASGIRDVVFMSSGGTVYGRPDSFPTPETHPTSPICAHGVAKLCVEHYLSFLSSSNSMNVTVLRASNVYGEYQEPRKGLGLIAAAIASARNGSPLEIWGNGSVVRDYLYVGDLVEALIALPACSSGFEVFNVGTGVSTSQVEVVRLVEGVSGRPVRVRIGPGRFFDIARSTLDISQAGRAGWRPRVRLLEGIERIWKHFEESTAPADPHAGSN